MNTAVELKGYEKTFDFFIYKNLKFGKGGVRKYVIIQ